MPTRRPRSRLTFRPDPMSLEERTLLDGRVDLARPAVAAMHVSPLPGVVRALATLPSGYGLSAFNPAGRPPAGGWPVVVAFEGAGFRQSDSRAYAARVARWLGPAGIAVVGISYPDQHWPGTFDGGILRAVAAIANSPQYNRNRMGVIGESSGATTALLVGLRNPTGGAGVPWRIRAVGDYYGAADFNRLFAELLSTGPDPFSLVTLRDYLIPYLGPPQPVAYALASPTLYVRAGDPAVFIAEGAAEKFGTAQSDLLASLLAARGVPREYYVLPMCTHGFGPNGEPGTMANQHCVGGTALGLGPKLQRFFAAHLQG